MPFQVSPGVNVSEIDLTTVVPAVATTEGALAGVFRWGPVDTRTLITSESELVAQFGKPTNHNPETFFTAADFLAYGNKLYVVRVGRMEDGNTTSDAISAIANTSSVSSAYTYSVKNDDDYDTKNFASVSSLLYVAKYPGKIGNSLKVSICDSVDGYSKSLSLVANAQIAANSTTGFTVAVGTKTANVVIAPADIANGDNVTAALDHANNLLTAITVGDYLAIGNTTTGVQYMKVSGKAGSVTQTTNLSHFALTFETSFNQTANAVYDGANTLGPDSFTRYWEYFNNVDGAPIRTQWVAERNSNTSVVDGIHVVIVDEKGEFTSAPGTLLEVFQNVSRATDAKLPDGTENYYKNVINTRSRYAWFANHRTNAGANTANNVLSSTNETPLTLSFVDGNDGHDESNVGVNILMLGYDKFKSAEDVDISLVLQGKARGGLTGTQLANYIIDNVVEYRKDCVAFVSPDKADTVGVTNASTMVANIVAFRDALTSTSYAVMDSGYKLRIDKYNGDTTRWTPLNGDVAGLCVRTDEQRDAWFSPAGFNRGIIKNCIRLAFNPNRGQRDELYKKGINPVVTFPGQGTVLYGDKTLQAKPSAFDRINVRRLFIVLEKAISTAAKFTLFEFNDDFTRAQFRAIVEPFLRDVQGRRGIYDFRVVCDATNNPGSVIDRNEFVGDIYVKPARSINFIQLNFVAVRSGVEFTEVVGQF